MDRTIRAVGLAVGGSVAAGFLSLGVATAAPDNDDSNPFGLTPFGPLNVTSQTGDPLGNVVYGAQTFSFNSADVQPLIADFLTDHVTVDGKPLVFDSGNPIIIDGLPANVIDKMQFGGTALQDLLGEQQILLPAIAGTNIDSGVIDIHNWGGDFGYLYMDLVGAGDIGDANDAIGAWLVTPFGTCDVSWWEDGSFFGFPYLESRLFDVDAFNPGADFSDDALTSAPGLFDWLDAFNL